MGLAPPPNARHSHVWEVRDDAAMRHFGNALYRSVTRQIGDQPIVIFLEGNLGAGKTTLVRGYLRAVGHAGAVRSPTYTLIEPYQIGPHCVAHLDLYRLGDPEELEYLGIRDLDHAQLLVEWPDKGLGFLPAADVRVVIDYHGIGRRVSLLAESDAGCAVVDHLLFK